MVHKMKNSAEGESAEMGLGIILGVIITIGLISVFFVYALPVIDKNLVRQNDPATIMLQVPANSSTTTTTTSGSGY